MNMLREWNGKSDKAINEILASFGIGAGGFRLLKYENLTPDSFIWVLGAPNKRLCLYAEDYVPSLDHVVQIMNEFGTLNEEQDKYTLLPVKEPQKFNSSSPVASSDVYNPPKNTDEFMKYAMPSGYDFVFLGISTLS